MHPYFSFGGPSRHPKPTQGFCDYSKPYGPTFQASDFVWLKYLEPSYATCTSRWQQMQGARNQNGDTLTFELNFVENRGLPNAFCGLHRGEHILLMYHTFPMALLELFHRLLSHPEFLRDFGNPSCESIERAHRFESPPGLAILRCEIGIRGVDDIATQFGPLCPIRRAAAMDLYHSAMTLIWEHEILHAVLGHLHYVMAVRQLGEIDELKFHAAPESSPLDRTFCFLEAQADAAAAFSQIFGPLGQRVLRVFSSKELPSVLKETKVQIISMALLSWFWMLLDVERAGGDPNAINIWSDHPSSLVRALGFLLRPRSQTSGIDDIVDSIVEESSETAAKELVSLSDTWDIFHQFKWLNKAGLYDSLMKEHEPLEADRRNLSENLQNYGYYSPASGWAQKSAPIPFGATLFLRRAMRNNTIIITPESWASNEPHYPGDVA